MQFIDRGQFKDDDDAQGHFKVNVFNDESYEIELNLESKDQCPNQTDKKRKTVIKLLCDPSGMVTHENWIGVSVSIFTYKKIRKVETESPILTISKSYRTKSYNIGAFIC